jgi:predicted nucleic acid-binding protein
MATYLLDKSAWARSETRSEVHDVIDPLTQRQRVATCGIADLEQLYSARSPADYAAMAERLEELPRVPVTEHVVRRALTVQRLLADKSLHRSVQMPDLLIAACAEIAGLTVLHYDSDYDRIAEFTGQPTEWVVPRGSVS